MQILRGWIGKCAKLGENVLQIFCKKFAEYLLRINIQMLTKRNAVGCTTNLALVNSSLKKVLKPFFFKITDPL